MFFRKLIAMFTQDETAKIAFLDKDGTLVETVSGAVIPKNFDDQRLLPETLKQCKELKKNGFTLVIVSNQKNVKLGRKSIDSATAEMRYAMSLLEGMIEQALFCPDDGETCYSVFTDGRVEKFDRTWQSCHAGPGLDLQLTQNTWPGFRKPQPGMLLKAASFYGATLEHCLMVGDRPEDEQAAQACSTNFIWAHEWRAGSMGRAVIAWIDGEPIYVDDYGTMEGEFCES